MCISPRILPNPNYRCPHKAIREIKDCKSLTIKVPCGVCPECLKARQASIVQRCMVESIYGYPFFASMSISPGMLLSLVCSDGQEIPYADLSDVVKVFKRIRKDNAFGRLFRYLLVSELGSSRSRPHYHALIFLKRLPGDNVYTPLNLESQVFKTLLSYYSRNYGSKRNPDYRPMCRYVRRWIGGKLHTTFDCHYVRPAPGDGSVSGVIYYVTKYLLKPSPAVRSLYGRLKRSLPFDEFDRVWRVVRPRVCKSLNFGFGLYDDYNARRMSRPERMELLSSLPSASLIKSSVARSRVSQDYPAYFCPESGRSMPLSHYYKTIPAVYSVDDFWHFYYKSPNQGDDNVILTDYRELSSLDLVIDKFDIQCRQIDSHDSFNSFIINDL